MSNKPMVPNIITRHKYHPKFVLEIVRMIQQDGEIDGSQLQFPSQKEQLATLHREDSFVKIPELRSEVKTISWTTNVGKNHVRRVKGAISL